MSGREANAHVGVEVDGPAFLEALTYRFVGHSRSDPGAYRPEGELDEWKVRDPILVLRAQLEEEGAAAADSGLAAAAQTIFMLRPHPAPRVTHYVIEIDGQKLDYSNGVAQWVNFVWPNPAGSPGASITASTFDGNSVAIANFPGRYGLEKLINSSQRSRRPDGAFVLSWNRDGIGVSVDLRIISNPQAQAASKSGTSASPAGLSGVVLPAEVADAEDDTPAKAADATGGRQ